MLMSPDIPHRINEHNPDAKVIAILRNPIDRAYSAYWFARLGGWETSPTFEVAIQRERDGEFKTRIERLRFTHLEHGHYQEHIENYRSVLGDSRLKVLLTEDLADNPRRTLSDLFAWLGVSPDVSDIDLQSIHNVTTTPRFPRLMSALTRVSAPARRFLSSRLSPMTVKDIKDTMRRLGRFGYVPFERPPMNPETREFLRGYYARHNPRLGELIGRDLAHWD